MTHSRLILAPPDRRQAVLDIMGSARRSLLFSVFRCDDFGVLEAVAAAVRRNVAVKIIVTSRAHGWKKRLDEVSALLEGAGAEVYRYPHPMKYHAKYIIADDGSALIGTFNLTLECFQSTRDFLVVTHDPDVISGLTTLFHVDSRTPGAPTPAITDQLIVGPAETRSRLTQLLESATQSIRILDHRLSDPRILALLKRAASSGIVVETLGSRTAGDLTPHGTLFLIDGRTAIIGSASLSAISLDGRRELAIVVTKPDVVRKLNSFFDTLSLP